MTRLARALVLVLGVKLGGPVAANAPPQAEAGPDRVVRAGETVVFDAGASRDPDGGVLAHSWDFGDGRTAVGRRVRHVFETPGRHVVTLGVRDTGDPAATGVDRLTVTVRAPPATPPVAEAGPDRVVTAGVPLVLDGTGSRDADGRILAFRWTLPGARREGPVIRHAFHAAGEYPVTLEVEDDRGLVARDTVLVVVRPAPNLPPVAEAGPDRRAAPGETLRVDAGGSRDPDGALVGWRWSVDGAVVQEGPVAELRFDAPGRHVVRLTVEDDDGAKARDALVVTVNAGPVAEAGPDRRGRSLRHVFDARGSRDADGAIRRYAWEFGDGTRAEGAQVGHVFPGPGRYRVRLTVTDDSGLANATATDTATVLVEAPPVAEAGPTRRAAPGETVVFDAGRAAGPDVVAVWTFGDGARHVGRTVARAFATPGRHAVRLTLLPVEGGAPLAIDETAVVVNAPPVADAGPDLRSAPGAEVRLDASASFDPDGEVFRYVWRIGETTRRSPVPVLPWVFDMPGRHAVTLDVIDDSGAANDTARDTLVVRVNAPPVAEAGPDRITADRAVGFEARAADPDGDPLRVRWDFGDGATGEGARVDHVYAGPGRYEVTLEVDDGTGFANSRARDAMTLRVNAAPLAEAGADVLACAGNVVTFDAAGSTDPDGDALDHRWSFDDGLTLAGAEVRRSFETAGVRVATLTVDDGTGAANARARDSVSVSVDPRPVAEAGPDRTVCTGEPVAFDGSGSTDLDGVVNRFRWRFGDGASAEGATPRHAYDTPGRYRVSLAIEGDPLPRCDNTDVDWATITVLPAPQVAIDAPRAAATGETVTFTARPDLPRAGAEVLAYDWTFPDGTTARGPVVAHAFDAPGRQRVRLGISVSGARAGCARAEAAHTVAVNAAPVAVIEAPEEVLVNRPVRLDGSASRDPDGALVAWRWSLTDGGELSGIAPEHVFTEPGVHTLRLEVEDGSGLSNAVSRATRRIEAVAPTPFRIDAPEAVCLGDPVALRPVFAGDPPEAGRLAWDLGDGTRAELSAVTHVYQAPGRYTVTATRDTVLAGTSVSQRTSHALRVNAAPVARAGPDIAACPGDAVGFDGARSFDPDGDALTAEWRFGDGTAGRGLSIGHAYAEPGVYRARLTVDDGSGLACAQASAVRRVALNAAPVADAGPPLRATLHEGRAIVRLDAGASFDPEGAPLRYLWSLDGGPQLEGRQVDLPVDRPGRHTVRLHVSDGTGLSCGVASDTTILTVE